MKHCKYHGNGMFTIYQLGISQQYRQTTVTTVTPLGAASPPLKHLPRRRRTTLKLSTSVWQIGAIKRLWDDHSPFYSTSKNHVSTVAHHMCIYVHIYVRIYVHMCGNGKIWRQPNKAAYWSGERSYNILSWKITFSEGYQRWAIWQRVK